MTQNYRKHTVILPDQNIMVFSPSFTINDCDNCTDEFHPIYWIHRFEFLSHELINNVRNFQVPNFT